jgi:hypothetical protein
MRSINELLRFLCLLFFLREGWANSAVQSQSVVQVITTPQTLDNYTYELQSEWPLTWEDCDFEINPIQSPVAISTHDLSVDCPDEEQISVWFEDAAIPYRLEANSLSINYQYSILHITNKANGQTTSFQSNSIHFHIHG